MDKHQSLERMASELAREIKEKSTKLEKILGILNKQSSIKEMSKEHDNAQKIITEQIARQGAIEKETAIISKIIENETKEIFPDSEPENLCAIATEEKN